MGMGGSHILAFLSLLLAVAPAWSSEASAAGAVCSKEVSANQLKDFAKILDHSFKASCQPKFIESMLRKKDSIQNTLNRVVEKGPKILVIGEGHSLGAGKLGYQKLIERLQSSGFHFDCLSLELTTDVQPVIDRHLDENQKTALNFNEEAGLVRDSRIPELIEWARKSSLPVFAVDAGIGKPTAEKLLRTNFDQALREISKSASLPLADRNLFMAETIDKLMRTEGCKQVLHVGGMAHLSSPESPQQSLPQLLREKKHKVVSVGLQSVNDHYGHGLMGSQKHFRPTALRCEPGQPDFEVIDDGFGVIPGSIYQLVLPPDGANGSVSWHDLDAMIFVVSP